MNADIDEDTVDFTPNYDNKLKEPTVLPAAIPESAGQRRLGIAVGMATNLATHNPGRGGKRQPGSSWRIRTPPWNS